MQAPTRTPLAGAGIIGPVPRGKTGLLTEDEVIMLNDRGSTNFRKRQTLQGQRYDDEAEAVVVLLNIFTLFIIVLRFASLSLLPSRPVIQDKRDADRSIAVFRVYRHPAPSVVVESFFPAVSFVFRR